MSVENIIEADDQFNTDSDYGDELSKYSASLTSSVVDYPVVEGRRFHAYREGWYMMPNDEKESGRLDILHALMDKVLDGQLHRAPLQNPQRILDLGTGNGIWAIAMADEYPSAEVIGNDLSPTQPSLVPPNVKFIVDDFEDEWGYENNPFDMVHSRYLVGSCKDFPRLFKQAFGSLKPGGYYELHEWDGNLTSDDHSGDASVCRIMQDTVNEVYGESGFDLFPGKNFEKWLTDAGFVNVNINKIKIPMGTWAKDPQKKLLGAYNMAQYTEAMEGFTVLPLTKKGWSKKEIDETISKARADLKNPRIHLYFTFYAVYAQKPE